MIVVEHQDRAMRCGFRFLATPLEQQEQRIEVVHQAETGREDLVVDLVADLVARVSSCCFLLRVALWAAARQAHERDHRVGPDGPASAGGGRASRRAGVGGG